MNFSSFDYFLALTRGVGACFCPENLTRLLLAAQPHGRLEMLRMPDTMAYPISFGYTKHTYPWSVLADFLRIARAQYPHEPKRPVGVSCELRT